MLAYSLTKGVSMAKFYALGNYTTQGFQGFCKDPGSDRSKAAQIAAEAVGAVSYTHLTLPTTPYV